MSEIIGRSVTGDLIYREHDVTVEQRIRDCPPEYGFRVRKPSGYWWAWCSCGWGIPEQYDRDEAVQLSEVHLADAAAGQHHVSRAVGKASARPDESTAPVDRQRVVLAIHRLSYALEEDYPGEFVGGEDLRVLVDWARSQVLTD